MVMKTPKKSENMTEQQTGWRKWVDDDVVKQAEKQFEMLKEKLLDEGGKEIQGYHDGALETPPHYPIEGLLKDGKLFEDNIIYNPIGTEGGCFDNALNHHDSNTTIWYGYALINDHWSKHYWLVNKDGYLIETTPLPIGLFEKYYGMDVTFDFH